MTSLPLSPNAPCLSTKAPSSSHAQTPTLSSSKPLPSLPNTTPPPHHEIIYLSQVMKGVWSLVGPSGSSVRADWDPSVLSLEISARTETNKWEVEHRKEYFNELLPRAKKPLVSSSVLSLPPRPPLPRCPMCVIYEGYQHKFTTACAEITDFRFSSSFLIRPTCSRGNIWEKGRMPLRCSN